MIRYLSRRFVQLIPTLLGATLLSFLLIQLTPGDFTDRFILDPNIDPLQLERLKTQLGLDKPVLVQYFVWLWHLVTSGYMGESFTYRTPATGVIVPLVLNSMLLVAISTVLTYLLSIPIGVWAATRKNSPGDHVVSFLTVIGVAVPNFFLILLLMIGVLSLQPIIRATGGNTDGWLSHLLGKLAYNPQLGLLFPVGGMRDNDTYDAANWLGKIKELGWHLVLPTLVITASSLAGLVRVVRAQVLDFIQMDFVRTARAKGTAPRRVIYKHVLRNALGPVVSGLGTVLPELVTGAGLVEFVYRWPGITPAFVAAIREQDLYVVMGLLTFSGVFLIVGNLISDLLLLLVDPRIRYQ